MKFKSLLIKHISEEGFENGYIKIYTYSIVSYNDEGKLHSITNSKGELLPSIECDGSRQWHKNGMLHRDDDPVLGPMPAIVFDDGEKHYYKNNKHHNDNGPAIIYQNGDKYWYKDDLLHRDDDPVLGPMPAVEYVDGRKEWYKNGVCFTPNPTKKFKEKLLELKSLLDDILTNYPN